MSTTGPKRTAQQVVLAGAGVFPLRTASFVFPEALVTEEGHMTHTDTTGDEQAVPSLTFTSGAVTLNIQNKAGRLSHRKISTESR